MIDRFFFPREFEGICNYMKIQILEGMEYNYSHRHDPTALVYFEMLTNNE